MNSMHKEIVISRLTAWLVALLAVWLTACSDEEKHEVVLPPGTPVTVNFCVDTYDGQTVSRAWGGTTTPSMSGEKMQSWVVIVVNNAEGDAKDKVEAVLISSALNDAETDLVDRGKAELFTGPKRVYTFANITPAQLETALGLTEGAISNQTLVGNVLIDEEVKAATFAPQGNNWTATKDAEGKYVGGIPMSNWQDINITKDNETHWLYVCRIIAKLEFEFQNLTDQPIAIKNLAINDITANASAVSLMPSQSVTERMTATLRPTLNDNRERQSVNLWTTNETSVTVASGDRSVQTLYVNESAVATTSRYGLFRLTLTIDRGEGVEELRYALVSNENDNWTYISRNDHRIIPILIEDYKLDLIPVDFPPIAVYPSSVKEEDGVFTCTFHAGGEFELIPVVTKYSTGTKLAYGTGDNQWSYVADSWITPATTPTGADNTPAIYVADKKPAWNDEDHLVSGEFNTTLGEAYHEMRVTVNKGGDAQRELLYRVWVIRK